MATDVPTALKGIRHTIPGGAAEGYEFMHGSVRDPEEGCLNNPLNSNAPALQSPKSSSTSDTSEATDEVNCHVASLLAMTRLLVRVVQWVVCPHRSMLK